MVLPPLYAIHRLVGPVCLFAGLVLTPPSGTAAPYTLAHIQSSGTLRACIWPRYHGFTYRRPLTGELSGMGIELSRQFAADLGVRVTYVDSSVVDVADDLARGRCDIAMFAIPVTPERMKRMRFAVPHIRSDVFAVVHRGSRVLQRWSDIDRPGVRVGVQAGSVAEEAAKTFHHAQVVVLQPPMVRDTELKSGRIDVYLTALSYARQIASGGDWARILVPDQPLLVRPYAYASALDDEAWGERIDRFVTSALRDGRITAAARRQGLEAWVEVPR